ncbi:MAG TPA: metallophosphoesterase [Cyclobacteriaceae bacterium]
MRNRIMTFFFFTIFFLVVDAYVFQAVVNVSKDWSVLWKSIVRYGFWVPTILSIAALLWWAFDDPYRVSANVRNWIITGLVATYFSKMFGVIVLFIDDIQRGVRWVVHQFQKTPESLPGEGITRSDFLSKTALAVTALPMGAFAYGIISGAHDYRIRRVTINLPNLPKSFDGIRIGQVSDIHSGSFWNKTAVKGGVEMLMKEKPDLIFFTGDLVNNEASEVKEYLPIFEKLKAPLGVYSVTGNHDYGDYKAWSSPSEKEKNFRDVVNANKQMGYDILMNENRIIKQGGDKIAIIGIENWGTKFSKHGKLDEAYKGTDEAAVKLLLSHDPTHWDAQVRPNYKDIDVAFAGHTHGFQFGVEIAGIRWSPVQYVYKQWGGLYKEDNQYLYVNRGFGYIGYPGRVGMPPEITIFELKSA